VAQGEGTEFKSQYQKKKKIYQACGNQKQAEITILIFLISDKAHFKQKSVSRDKHANMLIKGKIQQKDITIYMHQTSVGPGL
jgi:NACalpha-BTF3-like transcription factor